jgi:hypothetical protein
MHRVNEPPARLSKAFPGHPFSRMPQGFRGKRPLFLIAPLTLRP